LASAFKAPVSPASAPHPAVVGFAVGHELELAFDTMDPTRKIANLRRAGRAWAAAAGRRRIGSRTGARWTMPTTSWPSRSMAERESASVAVVEREDADARRLIGGVRLPEDDLVPVEAPLAVGHHLLVHGQRMGVVAVGIHQGELARVAGRRG